MHDSWILLVGEQQYVVNSSEIAVPKAVCAIFCIHFPIQMANLVLIIVNTVGQVVDRETFCLVIQLVCLGPVILRLLLTTSLTGCLTDADRLLNREIDQVAPTTREKQENVTLMIIVRHLLTLLESGIRIVMISEVAHLVRTVGNRGEIGVGLALSIALQ